MDPISTAVIAAVAAGSASGLTEVSKRLIVDAYESFKNLLKKRLGKDSAVVEAVEKVEKKPDREGPKLSLQEEVEDAGAAKDDQLIQAAEKLLALINSQAGGQEVTKNIIAMGDRSFAAENVIGSTINTGDKIETGGGAYFGGDVKAGRDVVGRDKTETSATGASVEDLAGAFAKIYETLEKKPSGPEKAVAEQAVKGFEEEAKKGDEADEETASKWMSILEKTVPDVAEVVVDALLSPGAAVGTVIRKVTQRAKENLKKKS